VLPTKPMIQRFAVRHVGAGGKTYHCREAPCEETACCRFRVRSVDCACHGGGHADQSTHIRGPAFPMVRLSCRTRRGRSGFTEQPEHPCDPTRTDPNFVSTQGAHPMKAFATFLLVLGLGLGCVADANAARGQQS
jgi:hypothetical protein